MEEIKPKFKVGDLGKEKTIVVVKDKRKIQITAVGEQFYLYKKEGVDSEYCEDIPVLDAKYDIAPKEVTITREKFAKACKNANYPYEGVYFDDLCKELGL